VAVVHKVEPLAAVAQAAGERELTTTPQEQQVARTQGAVAAAEVLQVPATAALAALAVPVLSSYEFAPHNSFNY
jgi:hypothetical protein